MRDPVGSQLEVRLIQMRIKTSYVVFKWWHRESTSQLFTWRSVSGGYQWLEGDASDVP
jgi:hypothetical protein